MTTDETSQSTAKPPTFEEALAQLDAIVQELEEGQIGLADGLTRYEQGVKLLKQCYQLLERAERKIELLSRVDSNGQVESEPFDDGAISLEEKAETRGRRRSRGPSAKPPAPPAEDDMDGGGRLF
jgi:exodeoxyribonuclease VII small subunit